MIVMPFIINFALTYIQTEIYGDVMMESVANVLSVVIDILSSLTYILTIGLVIILLRRRNNIAIIFYIISTLLIYGLGLLVTGITAPRMLPEHLVYLIPSVITDVLVLIAVIIICKRKINLQKCIIFSLLVITVIEFINNIIETYVLFNNYGYPSNWSEIFFILEPYLSLIVFAVVGYFTMLLLSVLLNKTLLNKAEKQNG